jgi:hypothetical protein
MSMRWMAWVLLGLVGCGGTPWIDKSYLSGGPGGADRPLLMPTEAHDFGTDLRAPLEALMDREMQEAFGARAAKLHPLKTQLYPAGLGNLAWQIPVAAFRRAKQEHHHDLAGTYYDWMDELPAGAAKLAAWAKARLEPGGGEKATFRYLLGANLLRLPQPKPGPLTYRFVVAIYDVVKRRIVAVHWEERTLPPKLDALRTALTGAGRRAADRLAPVLGQ